MNKLYLELTDMIDKGMNTNALTFEFILTKARKHDLELTPSQIYTIQEALLEYEILGDENYFIVNKN